MIVEVATLCLSWVCFCVFIQYLHSLMMMQQQGTASASADQTQRLAKIEMALEGLRNVIKSNPGTCQALNPQAHKSLPALAT